MSSRIIKKICEGFYESIIECFHTLEMVRFDVSKLLKRSKGVEIVTNIKSFFRSLYRFILLLFILLNLLDVSIVFSFSIFDAFPILHQILYFFSFFTSLCNFSINPKKFSLENLIVFFGIFQIDISLNSVVYHLYGDPDDKWSY